MLQALFYLFLFCGVFYGQDFEIAITIFIFIFLGGKQQAF